MFQHPKTKITSFKNGKESSLLKLLPKIYLENNDKILSKKKKKL